MYLTDAYVTSVTFVQESKEPVLASDIVCVLSLHQSIVRECRQQLRRERATLKMYELDAVTLFAIDSDEPKLGLAFLAIAHRNDFAIARQNSN